MNAVSIGPVVKRQPAHLRAVFENDGLGQSAGLGLAVQDPQDTRAGQRDADFDRRAGTGDVVGVFRLPTINALLRDPVPPVNIKLMMPHSPTIRSMGA